MKLTTILAAAAAFALPAIAHAQDAPKAKTESCCCEKMKEAGKDCCADKEQHQGMDHENMDHGQMDHGQTDHGNHGGDGAN